MNNFYFTYDRLTRKKCYYGLNGNVSLKLNENERIDILLYLSNSKVVNVANYGDSIKILFDNNSTLFVDDVRVFSSINNDVYDLYLSKIDKNVRKYIENQKLRDYSVRSGRGTHQKVNRSHALLKKAILAVVGTSLVLTCKPNG